MESPYQKMYVLPEEEYHRLTITKQDPKTMQMERELSDLKEQQNLPPDQWHKVQSHISSRGRDMQSYTTKESVTPEPEPTKVKWVEQVIQRFPKNNQQRALQMLNLLITRQISWNSEGEVKNLNGDVLSNTNIVDLINYMTLSQRRRHLVEPKGLSEFVKLLQSINMPNNVLGLIGHEAMEPAHDSISQSGSGLARPNMLWHSLK